MAAKKAARKKSARKKAAKKKGLPGPGIHLNIPDGIYHSWPHAVSQSTLKTVRALTPAHARDNLLHPKEQTDAMAFGEALHLAALEPDEFGERVVCGLGVTRQSAANKELWKLFEEQNKGKLIISESKYAKLEAMSEALRSHRLASSLLDMPGHREASVLWEDEETGLLCKGRYDLIGRWQDMNVIADVKTTDCDLSDDALKRTIGNFGYDVQAAYYLDGANVLAAADRHFLLIFVTKKPPHHIRVIEPTENALFQGRTKYRKALRTWAKCVKEDNFPGFPEVVTQLDLMRWDELSDHELDEEIGR